MKCWQIYVNCLLKLCVFFQDDEAEPQLTKSSFTVKLMKIDAGKKVAIIKEIKNILEGMNLVQVRLKTNKFELLYFYS